MTERLGRLPSVLVLGAVWLFVAAAARQEHPPTPHSHPEGQRRANPVPATPASVEAGGKLYGRYCANCHGVSGRGNGKLAAGTAMYGKRPSDLADDVWDHGATDGEIFLAVRDGIGPDFHMDAFGRVMPDEEVWNVVNYIKTLTIGR